MVQRARRMFGPAFILWVMLTALLGSLLTIHYYHKGLPDLSRFGVTWGGPPAPPQP